LTIFVSELDCIMICHINVTEKPFASFFRVEMEAECLFETLISISPQNYQKSHCYSHRRTNVLRHLL